MLTRAFQRTALGLLLLLVVGAGAVGAGEEDPSVPGSPEDATRRILEEEQDTVVRLIGLRRARISYPLKLSGGVGVMRVRQPRNFDGRRRLHSLFPSSSPFPATPAHWPALGRQMLH